MYVGVWGGESGPRHEWLASKYLPIQTVGWDNNTLQLYPLDAIAKTFP